MKYPSKKIHSGITISGLVLSVNLGWSEEERLKKQKVTLDILLQFPKPPHACETDQLADTYCYDALIHSIKEHVAGKEFKLLEFLGCDLYRFIKNQLQNSIKIQVKLKKQPPIADLTQGITFEYGDKI